MFCTQCGTQVDRGNFCSNCGARIGQAAQSSPMSEKADPAIDRSETVGPVAAPYAGSSQTQPQSVPAAPAHGGNKKLIVVAAGAAVIVLAAAGAYFGTDLMKPSAAPTAPRVPEPISKSAEAPPLPNFEESKDAGATAGNPLASATPPLPPDPAAGSQGESPKPPTELLSESAPARKSDLPPPQKSQFKRVGETPSPSGRVNRPPAAASGGGASPGVYETLRATAVHEDPSPSSKVLASIPAGTRVSVVNSSGEWLEVHSRRGNPPGFIRRGDAALVESSN